MGDEAHSPCGPEYRPGGRYGKLWTMFAAIESRTVRLDFSHRVVDLELAALLALGEFLIDGGFDLSGSSSYELRVNVGGRVRAIGVDEGEFVVYSLPFDRSRSLFVAFGEPFEAVAKWLGSECWL